MKTKLSYIIALAGVILAALPLFTSAVDAKACFLISVLLLVVGFGGVVSDKQKSHA